MTTSAAHESDTALMQAVANRDGAALARLYDRFASGLNGLALRMVGNAADAEEVLADAFTQAWLEAKRFDASRGSVGAWLVTMTRSRALDLIRSRGRRGRLADAAREESLTTVVAVGGAADSPLDVTMDREQAARVQTALEALPAEQREVLILAYFEGLSQSQIAERIAVPLGTVKTRARLALAKLRDPLRGLAPDSNHG